MTLLMLSIPLYNQQLSSKCQWVLLGPRLRVQKVPTNQMKVVCGLEYNLVSLLLPIHDSKGASPVLVEYSSSTIFRKYDGKGNTILILHWHELWFLTTRTWCTVSPRTEAACMNLLKYAPVSSVDIIEPSDCTQATVIEQKNYSPIIVHGEFDSLIIMCCADWCILNSLVRRCSVS